jgi:hypothetical protein
MTSWFNYWGHMCLIFELLGLSVFDFLVSLYSTALKMLTQFLLTEREQLPPIPTGAGT